MSSLQQIVGHAMVALSPLWLTRLTEVSETSQYPSLQLDLQAPFEDHFLPDYSTMIFNTCYVILE